jgi:hypothetical protein
LKCAGNYIAPSGGIDPLTTAKPLLHCSFRRMGAERPVEFTAYKKSLLGRSRPSPEFKSVRFKSLAEPAHSSELTVMAIGLSTQILWYLRSRHTVFSGATK